MYVKGTVSLGKKRGERKLCSLTITYVKYLTLVSFAWFQHDSTIAAVTSAMKVFNFLNPPYAAALFVELHQIGDQYFVWLRYYNDSGAPYNLTHPGNPNNLSFL